MKCTLQVFLAKALIILCHSTLLRWSHHLPSQLPGEHTGLPSHAGAIPHSHLPFRTTLIHTIMLGRQKYGGWECSNGPHMFFYVHQSHRHDSTHPSFLKSWVPHISVSHKVSVQLKQRYRNLSNSIFSIA